MFNKRKRKQRKQSAAQSISQAQKKQPTWKKLLNWVGYGFVALAILVSNTGNAFVPVLLAIGFLIWKIYLQRKKINAVEIPSLTPQQPVSNVRENEIESYGLYEPKYNFETALLYKNRLKQIRDRQKEMIRNKQAVISGTEWVVQGSKKDGQKLIDEQVKLMLRAFNGECESLILKVTYKNVQSVEKRIHTLYEAINKLGKSQDCQIIHAYLMLKTEELYLVYEYEQKLQDEKEEQRQIREQMKEEARVHREIEREQRKAEEEESRYQSALEEARRELGDATQEEQDKLQSKIAQLNALLAEANQKKERAISLAQTTRSGYVYIISNLGSFGEDVYKIGMTRRLEPLDRVKELGDASVPFPFDVHALIYSDDAPGLESELHKQFDAKRVNRINQRKEFFKVNLNEIRQVVEARKSEITFTMVAEAQEYRQGKSMNGNRQHADILEPEYSNRL